MFLIVHFQINFAYLAKKYSHKFIDSKLKCIKKMLKPNIIIFGKVTMSPYFWSENKNKI